MNEANAKKVLDWAFANDVTPIGKAYLSICNGIADFEFLGMSDQIQVHYTNSPHRYSKSLLLAQELLYQSRDAFGS